MRRCCHIRCRKPATVVYEFGKPGAIRRYEVCDDHATDYFGRGPFLSDGRVDRIRRDLVPASIG